MAGAYASEKEKKEREEKERKKKRKKYLAGLKKKQKIIIV
jgi:hypothetical protein